MELFLLVLLASLGLINPLNFEETREQLLQQTYEFYERVKEPTDGKVSRYITSQKFKSFVNFRAISRFVETTYIPYGLKFVDIVDELNIVHRIEKKKFGDEESYEYYYGAEMHDEKIIYIILFRVTILNKFTFKLVDTSQTKCTTTVNGAKTCKTETIKVPDDSISVEDYMQLQKYIEYQCAQKIKHHIEQIKELNGKILFAFNEGEIDHGDDYTFGQFGGTIYNKECEIKLLIRSPDPSSKIKTGFGNGEYYPFPPKEDEEITGYLTDDGYINFMFREGYVDDPNTKLIYKKKLFNPSGFLPYKFIMTNDANFIIYDANYKILVSLRQKCNFTNVDFAMPDEIRFCKKGDYCFYILQNYITFYKLKSSEYTEYCITKNYKNLFSTGYLIVDNKGILKHISYEYNIIDWQPIVEVKGNGPYSLDTFNFGLVLLNGDGDVYWSTLDEPIDKINEEYKAYLKTIDN